MGSLSYEYLQPTENPRSPAEALSGSTLVGGRPITDRTSAIAILRNDGGELVFGDEVPLQAFSRRRSIRLRGGVELSWIRLEFKAERTAQEIGRDSFLIVTEHPRSSFWWHEARFRPTSKKSRDERRGDDPETWTLEDRDQILEKLESLPYDPWETDGRYLTAGISRPAPGLNLHRTREQKISISQLYGVSRMESGDLSRELFETDHAKGLLEQTQKRKIRFWPKEAAGKKHVLADETIAEAQTLLHGSIQQALAGPHEESEAWVDRPVMDLADRIYRDHLYNANRRYQRRESGEEFDEHMHSRRR